MLNFFFVIDGRSSRTMFTTIVKLIADVDNVEHNFRNVLSQSSTYSLNSSDEGLTTRCEDQHMKIFYIDTRTKNLADRDAYDSFTSFHLKDHSLTLFDLCGTSDEVNWSIELGQDPVQLDPVVDVIY